MHQYQSILILINIGFAITITPYGQNSIAEKLHDWFEWEEKTYKYKFTYHTALLPFLPDSTAKALLEPSKYTTTSSKLSTISLACC